MYKSHRPYRPHTNRFRRHSVSPKKKMRSFDPTHLVSNIIPSQVVQEPHKIVNSFASFEIPDSLKRNVLARGYVTPTPIQDQTIPTILKGQDVIGIANTGTGKTAAFLIPLISLVMADRNKRVLIVTPTRELAVQIKQEFVEFARGLGIYFALGIGGMNINMQKAELRRRPNFFIGTPGRIYDLIKQKSVDLSTFDIVVLDEADQMVDIGFIDQIKYFISLLSKTRQSLFFSATVDGKVKEILAGFVNNPVTVSVKKQEMLHNIKQDVIKVADTSKKIDQLHDLLIKKEFEKVLIFGRTKWGVQRLSDELVKRGFSADVIHGNKGQSQRLRILDKFKRNEIQILLATDVASRGLDINNVTHVINYDPPESYEVYIHRIGRTGRADKTGTALTFV